MYAVRRVATNGTLIRGFGLKRASVEIYAPPRAESGTPRRRYLLRQKLRQELEHAAVLCRFTGDYSR